MASGDNKITLNQLGTGAALYFECGFEPRVVQMFTVGGDSAYWQVGMAAGAMFKKVADGSAAASGSFVTTGGVTVDGAGFTLGTDADINTNGQRIYVLAWR